MPYAAMTNSGRLAIMSATRCRAPTPRAARWPANASLNRVELTEGQTLGSEAESNSATEALSGGLEAARHPRLSHWKYCSLR